MRLARVVAALCLLALLVACERAPRPIAYGHDGCDYCRMVISDPRYGAELVTATGKVHTFDSIECLAAYYLQARASGAAARSVVVSDFERPGTFLPAAEARYLRAAGPASPMGKGLTAFAPGADSAALRRVGGDAAPLRWDEVLALVEREGMARGAGAAASAPSGEPGAR